VTREQTLLSRGAAFLSQRLAERVSRRSFLARVGRGAIAVAMGGSAALALPDRGYAHDSCECGSCSGSCCGALTVRCENLPGWNRNRCPSDSCICGCWWESVSTSVCSSGIREWCDCCRGCTGCDCVNDHPTCCRHKTYSSRSQCASGCNHIRCRRWRCIDSTFTVTTC
jgi:hypothetical protein